MNVEKLKGNGEIEKTWPSFHPLLNFDHPKNGGNQFQNVVTS